MRRDIGSELVVAIIAVAALTFALSFAILLALSSNNVQAEQTTVADSNVDETDNAESTVEVEFMTDTPAPTATTKASNTPQPTPSHTAEIPPSQTDEPSANPAAATNTLTHTPTKTATLTPSRTATLTLTPSPTHTPTRKPSATHTPTITFTPTATPVPTRIAGILPTPTHPSLSLLQDLADQLRTYQTCEPNTNWRTYEVQSGNTLFAIALAVNSTVDELKEANCLQDASRITTGDRIYVPRLPVGEVRNIPGADTNTDTSNSGIIGCTNPNIQITSPSANQTVSGTIQVIGTVQDENFLYYKLEVQPPNSTVYNFISDAYEPVQNGVLGTINTAIFAPGVHRLRLSMVDVTAGIQVNATCDIPLIFE